MKDPADTRTAELPELGCSGGCHQGRRPCDCEPRRPAPRNDWPLLVTLTAVAVASFALAMLLH